MQVLPMHLDKWTPSITRAGLHIVSSVATTPKGRAYNTHGKDTAARESRSMDGREAGRNENSCTSTGQTQLKEGGRARDSAPANSLP